MTLTYFSEVLRTVLLGPVGSILAVPLTLSARFLIVCGDPNACFAQWVSGAADPEVSWRPPDEPRTPE